MTYVIHDEYGAHPAPFRHTLPPLFNSRATATEMRWANRWRRVYCDGFSTYVKHGARRLTVTAS